MTKSAISEGIVVAFKEGNSGGRSADLQNSYRTI